MKRDVGRSHLLRWLERAEDDHASMRPAHDGWACCDCALATAIKGRLRSIVNDAVLPVPKRKRRCG